jgi:hypothetical protein
VHKTFIKFFFFVLIVSIIYDASNIVPFCLIKNLYHIQIFTVFVFKIGYRQLVSNALDGFAIFVEIFYLFHATLILFGSKICHCHTAFDNVVFFSRPSSIGTSSRSSSPS